MDDKINFTLDYLLDKIILFLLLPIVALSFVINSLSSDPQIYQGIARLTDYFGTFPQNVDLIWEVKPIANRMLNYLLYKFTTLFVPFSEHYLYGVGIKIVTLIIVLLICYYFSRQVKIKYSFHVSAILLLSTSNVATLQAEWWAVVFTLVAIGLMLDDNKWLNILSGVVISIVFFFKGISGVFMVTSLFAVYLLNPDLERMKKVTMRMLAGFIALTAIILFSPLFPNVLSDLFLTTKIAPIGRLTFEQLIANLTVKSYVAFIDLPFLLTGFLFGAYLYILYMKDKKFKEVGVLILMWLSVISMILIQGEFFTYHYSVLLIPTIISILLCRKYITHAPISAIFITFMFFLFFTSYWSTNGIIETKYWERKSSDAFNITTQFPDLKEQPNILYLEACNGPYYFEMNATSRYICSLPVQRNAKEWWDLTGLKEYKEDYNSIITYTGKYVIFEDSNWFYAYNATQTIDEKIQREYTKVYDKGSWRVWQRKI